MEKCTLDYFINQMNLSNCTIMSKDSSIYYVKSKFYSLISINQYILYDPIYILKKMEIDICPLYILNLNYMKLSSFLKIEDFTNRYKNSDLDMYHYLNEFKNEISVINNLDMLDFLEKSCMYKTIIYIRCLKSINSLMQELNSKMNLHMNKNQFSFSCITQKNSFGSCVFDVFINTLQNQPLPILPSSTPGHIKNSSKFEICFCETLTHKHLSDFKNHKVKSYVNNDGEQFKKNKFSLDW